MAGIRFLSYDVSDPLTEFPHEEQRYRVRGQSEYEEYSDFCGVDRGLGSDNTSWIGVYAGRVARRTGEVLVATLLALYVVALVVVIFPVLIVFGRN